MTYPRPCKNIKACPECGTNLIISAKHCAVCGYAYPEADIHPAKEAGAKQGTRLLSTMVNKLLLLVGMIILALALSNLFILGMQKRDETKARVAGEKATATYIATTYISPTPSATMTFTPGPPTPTPEVIIEYEVLPGDSCLSIVTKFNIDLGTLIQKNRGIDCSLLSLGTVLEIPQPTPTPEPSSTPTPKAR